MRASTLLLVTTIASAVIYVAAAAVLGTPPDADADGATVAAWFASHQGAVRGFVWLLTLLVPVTTVGVVLVRRLLPAPHRDVYFAGGLIFVAETAVSGWLWGALSWHTGTMAPATARVLLDMASFWGPVLTGATMLMFAPIALLGLGREPVLPRWLGVLAGIALLEQIVETVTVFGRTGFIAPGGPMNLYLGAALGLATILAVGIVLSRRPDPSDARTVDDGAGRVVASSRPS